ncbi:hypothetical protein [Paraburkholderia sp. J41]|uniref:hypothetical protein n=1 Tax=Paraburkholderia sp. J41 TaxID=2805433 RepID=UPI002AC36B78|nr:hypothetical protein [Paraburkholderia sp. J41]
MNPILPAARRSRLRHVVAAAAAWRQANGSEAQDLRAVAIPRHGSSLLENVFRMCPRGPVHGNVTNVKPDRAHKRQFSPPSFLLQRACENTIRRGLPLPALCRQASSPRIVQASRAKAALESFNETNAV